MIFFKHLWHSGTDRDEDPGDVLDPQPDWKPPLYLPGQVVRYTTPKRTEKGYAKHIGKIRFVLRATPNGMDYYRVIRLKNDSPEVTFESLILEIIED